MHFWLALKKRHDYANFIWIYYYNYFISITYSDAKFLDKNLITIVFNIFNTQSLIFIFEG